MIQLKYYRQDLNRNLRKSKWRIITLIFTRYFVGITLYRVERSLFLLFGKHYNKVRILLMPLFNLIQAFSNLEIHYKADIKGGFLVLHPACGCVVSRHAVIGENFTMTGGNIIGAKPGCKIGEIVVGNSCTMGANATLIGPVKIGNNISIGASACVVKDCLEDNAILVGVPAKKMG